jgi:membrane associated rhomboid family serine protease
MFHPTKAVKTILFINLIAFLITIIFPGFIFLNFAMYNPSVSSNFTLWQLISYQFLHVGLSHILFNMLALLTFGPEIEEIYGQKKFYIYYLICGVSSALLHCLMTKSGSPLVGASGSVFGILAMWGLYFPNRKINLFFIPIDIKVKYLVSILIISEVIMGFITLFFSSDKVSHFGHIGGALAGLVIFLATKSKKYH